MQLTRRFRWDGEAVEPERPATVADGEGAGDEPRAIGTKLSRWWRSMLRQRAPAVLSVICVAAIWEALAYFELVNPLFLPRLSAILAELWEFTTSGDVVTHASATGSAMLVGLGLAILIGVPLGLAAGSVRLLDRLLAPWINALNSLPRSIVFTPLAVVVFGISQTARVSIVLLGATIPILITVTTGTRTVDRQLFEMAQSFRVKRIRTFTTVTIPATIPSMFSGFRLAIGHALIAVIVAEFYASRSGIGFVLTRAGSTYNIERVWAMIIILGLIGMTLAAFAARLERRFDAWRATG